MKKLFTVFSVHTQPCAVQVTLPGGASTTAVVTGLEVQLTPTCEGDGTLKLTYTDPDEIAEVSELFEVGSNVEINFAAP